jgi:hypothetical protein
MKKEGRLSFETASTGFVEFVVESSSTPIPRPSRQNMPGQAFPKDTVTRPKKC